MQHADAAVAVAVCVFLCVCICVMDVHVCRFERSRDGRVEKHLALRAGASRRLLLIMLTFICVMEKT